MQRFLKNNQNYVQESIENCFSGLGKRIFLLYTPTKCKFLSFFLKCSPNIFCLFLVTSCPNWSSGLKMCHWSERIFPEKRAENWRVEICTTRSGFEEKSSNKRRSRQHLSIFSYRRRTRQDKEIDQNRTFAKVLLVPELKALESNLLWKLSGQK